MGPAETTPPSRTLPNGRCTDCGRPTLRAELESCKGKCRTCHWWTDSAACWDRLERELGIDHETLAGAGRNGPPQPTAK